MPKTVGSKRGGIIAAVIMVIVFAGAGVMFYYGEREADVRIADNQIQIEAMYGLDIDFSGVTGVSLIEKSMQEIGVGRRDNGYGGFGDTLKGHFSSDNLGKVLLFVKVASSPTIRIARGDAEPVYISFSDAAKTKLLYEALIAALPPA
ncbi:hypothetical protein SDC9_205030 [bioreactor metagenome]|uniref:Bacterial Pleckstrin homology domain-containing protein n=1 Tax=bioreactor metagenome TaxID=1076179 RepID=A0A645J1K9_9ZZZZ